MNLDTVSQRAGNNEEKIEKLKTFDLSFFIGKNIFGGDDFQNMFVYQLTLNTLELNSHNIKLSGYKVGIQFNKSV